MVLSKLLVNNLVTKSFEMLLWKCNFISLHDEHCKRVYVSNGGTSNIQNSLHMQFCMEPILFLTHHTCENEEDIFIHRPLQCQACASEVCILHDRVVSSVSAITFSSNSHQLNYLLQI